MSMFMGWYVMTTECRSATVRLLPGMVTNPPSVLLPHELELFCQVVKVPTYRKKPPYVASLWCTQPASSLRRSVGRQEYFAPSLLPIATLPICL